MFRPNVNLQNENVIRICYLSRIQSYILRKKKKLIYLDHEKSCINLIIPFVTSVRYITANNLIKLVMNSLYKPHLEPPHLLNPLKKFYSKEILDDEGSEVLEN